MTSTLLVCSGGGHLKQLFSLADRIGIPADEQCWVTFDNGLSRSLLADREVITVPFAGPRDGRHLSAVAVAANHLLRHRRFDMAISTGSGPAVAVLPQALAHGAEAHYIESAARAAGPSLSGRLVAHLKRIHTYTQYPAWASERWQYRGSIFDCYDVVPGPPRDVQKVVVSVGTQDGYAFPRLFERLVPLLDGLEVLWQSGTTDLSRWGITGRHSVEHDELKQAIAEADLVVSHAGVGAAVTAIELGKTPVLVPRLERYGEHVDDHQLQVAGELHRRDLALMRHVDQLDAESLRAAAGRSTLIVDPPAYRLDGGAQRGEEFGDRVVATA